MRSYFKKTCPEADSLKIGNRIYVIKARAAFITKQREKGQ